jgi:hypothetical protein
MVEKTEVQISTGYHEPLVKVLFRFSVFCRLWLVVVCHHFEVFVGILSGQTSGEGDPRLHIELALAT